MINYWGIIATIILFNLSKSLKKYPVIGQIPPILITGLVLMLVLKLFNLSFESYNKSASWLTFLLIPAIISLGYPLYKHLDVLIKNKRIIYSAFCLAVGCTVIVTFLIAYLCHTEMNVIGSMLPKSVTAPIAIEISKSIGGIPELTACVVVLTGVFGAIFGHKLLKFFGVKNDIAIGLAMGAASHVIATVSCIETGREKQVVMSTLALVIVGIITAIVLPLILKHIMA